MQPAQIRHAKRTDALGCVADASDVYPAGGANSDDEALPPIIPDPAGSSHAFVGRHYVASYVGCDVATLTRQKGLLAALEAAVTASGATLLKTCEYAFPEGGCTVVMLLSESHASIHTYPEYAACFIDLFTCGQTCRAERFDEVLRAYLRPREAHGRMLLRAQDVVDDRFGN